MAFGQGAVATGAAEEAAAVVILFRVGELLEGVALETADVAVLHGRVTDIAQMIRLSRVVMANIRQNITNAPGLKAVFLVAMIAGVTGLWPAILADTGATVLVTANAMALLRSQGPDRAPGPTSGGQRPAE